MKLTQENKQNLAQAMIKWMDVNPTERSGNKLADKAGTSSANISFIRNGKLDIASDEIYHKVAAVIGFKFEANTGIIHWETDNFNKIQSVCRSAQANRKIVLLDSDLSGVGKTYSLEYYAMQNPDKTLYIKCKHSMGKKDLLSEILRKLGIREDIKGDSAKIDAIREKVTTSPGWLIIIDEAEDLKLTLFKLLKEIIDFIYNRCALIVSGMGLVYKINRNALPRITNDVVKQPKEGWPQLRRRLFPTQVKVGGIAKKEMVNILETVEITDKNAQTWFIKHVYDFQMFVQYVSDALKVSQRENLPITAEFLNDLFLTL
jgi:hypothetical protein